MSGELGLGGRVTVQVERGRGAAQAGSLPGVCERAPGRCFQGGVQDVGRGVAKVRPSRVERVRLGWAGLEKAPRPS